MFLRSIEVSDFVCFPHLEVAFDGEEAGARRSTVLIGENESGKSTLLKAIALITAGSDSLPLLCPRPKRWVRLGAEQARIDATLATAEGELRHISLEISAEDGARELMHRNRDSLEQLDRALMHSDRNYFVAGYGASRRIGNAGFRSDYSERWPDRASSVATLFDPSRELVPFESWAMDLDYRRDDEGRAIVRDVLTRFVPGMAFAGIDKTEGTVLFESLDGPVPLNSLSDGFQNVIAWVGDLLFRVVKTFGDFSDPLSARGLLLIDEVDLHLHPVWQKRLLDLLRTQLPNMQMVLTTHSPITAQQADEDSLFFLKRDPDGAHIHQFSGSPGMFRINQLLTSEAFGLETDESAKIENLKSRYDDLFNKDEPTPEEREELLVLGQDLRGIAIDARSTLTQEQQGLMQQLLTQKSSDL